MSYTNVDSKLKAISVKIVNSQEVAQGNVKKEMFKSWWT